MIGEHDDVLQDLTLPLLTEHHPLPCRTVFRGSQATLPPRSMTACQFSKLFPKAFAEFLDVCGIPLGRVTGVKSHVQRSALFK